MTAFDLRPFDSLNTFLNHQTLQIERGLWVDHAAGRIRRNRLTPFLSLQVDFFPCVAPGTTTTNAGRQHHQNKRHRNQRHHLILSLVRFFRQEKKYRIQNLIRPHPGHRSHSLLVVPHATVQFSPITVSAQNGRKLWKPTTQVQLRECNRRPVRPRNSLNLYRMSPVSSHSLVLTYCGSRVNGG